MAEEKTPEKGDNISGDADKATSNETIEQLKKDANENAYKARKANEALRKEIDDLKTSIIEKESGKNDLTVDEKIDATSDEVHLLKLENARMKAINRYKLDEKDAQFLTGNSPDEIIKQAEFLAQRLGSIEKEDGKKDGDGKKEEKPVEKPKLPSYDTSIKTVQEHTKQAKDNMKEWLDENAGKIIPGVGS